MECSGLAVVLPFPVFALFHVPVANDHERSANGDLGSGGRCVALSPKYIAPSTVRPLARGARVLVGWPLPLGFGLDGRLLLARRGRVYV